MDTNTNEIPASFGPWGDDSLFLIIRVSSMADAAEHFEITG
jgi:hypothetical protein